MATERQIEANRLNAQKSTGPRTPEGKAAVRFNALKHGLHARVLVIPGEDQDELDALAFEYYGQFGPETAVARYLVDTLIHCDWNRRRLLRLQANIITALSGEDPSGPLARADRAALGSAPLDRVFRQLNAMERHYFRALAELQRQSERPPTQEIGFVPPEWWNSPPPPDRQPQRKFPWGRLSGCPLGPGRLPTGPSPPPRHPAARLASFPQWGRPPVGALWPRGFPRTRFRTHTRN